MGKGNGAHKISSIWLDHEIDWRDAVVGDMIIVKENGQWDRIKELKENLMTMERFCLTKFGKEYMIDEVIVVRY